ncbi:unnamed protein product [Calypogeia fissa]
MPTSATGRLSSGVSVSSGSSCVWCRRVLHILSGRRVAQQAAAVIGNWKNLAFYFTGAVVVAVSSSFIRREPSAIAWGKKVVKMASQASKELVKVRSVYEDTDDPVVSTERLAKPVSYVPIPDVRRVISQPNFW